ncbi:TlpA disulfide reductase family protein [Evansella sp. AB-P1]|uniref:TlpA family protein disulfide reductase n=1 Tax=Evansella sp. AB-P1 TaxID=3037653 RepID=UPI00241D25A1|nr:TlpA disulfide reductase family protein [Evansella sp. AB-P1]MDG5789056.1 TlpA disulfide reductase family protein [Evansella sp. AB-P1]
MIILKRILFISIMITVGIFLWMEQQQKQFDQGYYGVATLPQPGYRAPDFSLASLTNEEKKMHLSRNDENSKGTIVYFWTSWCPFCAASMKSLEEAYVHYGNDIRFIGINVTKQDSISNATAFIEENNIHFPIVLDEEGIVSANYYVPPIPATFLIDSDGYILNRKVGAITSFEVSKWIQQLEGGIE